MNASRKIQLPVFIALVLIMALALMPVARVLADNVQNDVATVGDLKLVTITAGSPTGATVYYNIHETSGDSTDKNPEDIKCNPSDGTSATVTPQGMPAGVSITPGSVTFTNCTDAKGIVFTAASSTIPGDYLIYVTVGDSGAVFPRDYNTSPATFTLRVEAPPTPVDTTPPAISYILTPALPDGSNGWYKSNVTLTWTVTETESPASLQKTGCVDQAIVADQFEVTYSCSASSAGGPSGPVNVSIKRDATAPVVSLVGGPTDGASYYFGFVPAAPACDASDATSGLAGICSVTGYDGKVGTHTVTATATDLAGNSGSASATYEVMAWTLNGFFQPVDMKGIINVVKGGSTVPLKFEVFAGTTELSDPSVVKSFVQTRVACDGTVAVDDIEFTTTGSTSLRYDMAAGQFVQNWQTPKLPGQCYNVTMTTQDGSSLVAFFKLK